MQIKSWSLFTFKIINLLFHPFKPLIQCLLHFLHIRISTATYQRTSAFDHLLPLPTQTHLLRPLPSRVPGPFEFLIKHSVDAFLHFLHGSVDLSRQLIVFLVGFSVLVRIQLSSELNRVKSVLQQLVLVLQLLNALQLLLIQILLKAWIGRGWVSRLGTGERTARSLSLKVSVLVCVGVYRITA